MTRAPGIAHLPPWALAVVAMLSVQLGSALSVQLIATTGAAEPPGSGSAWAHFCFSRWPVHRCGRYADPTSRRCCAWV